MTLPQAPRQQAESVGQHLTGEDGESPTCPGIRHGLIAFGWLNVGLGALGLFLPVMPTTVFLLIALWAFSKSSPRFHRWLYAHPRLGRRLRDWHRHRVIPWPAKLLAVTMMLAGLLFVALFVSDNWVLPTSLGLLLTTVAAYILSRPSQLPKSDPASL